MVKFQNGKHSPKSISYFSGKQILSKVAKWYIAGATFSHDEKMNAYFGALSRDFFKAPYCHGLDIDR